MFYHTQTSVEQKLSWKMEFSFLAQVLFAISQEENIQSFIVCGFLEIQKIVFDSLPFLETEGQWNFVIGFVGNWVSLLLNTTHPIVLFTFNKEVRTYLINHFHFLCDRQKKTNPTTTILWTR